MRKNEYGLQDVRNLEAIYIVKGKAVFVTMSGKLVPPHEANRGWHWDVQLSPYQGEDKKEVLKKYYPNTRIISDDSKKWASERGIFRDAAEKLVDDLTVFDSLSFPVPKNVAATTIADRIIGVQPIMESPVIKRQYQDHMGDTVIEYEGGGISRYSYSSTHLYGDYGHSFGFGYFIVNETGEMVFASQDPEQYNALSEKCQPFWKVLKGLQERFPDYRVEMSRGERLAVNDKIIKGFLFYPGMLHLPKGMDVEIGIQKEMDFIANEIQLDIDRGRIVKGEYGRD
jgi:hypothetical protein